MNIINTRLTTDTAVSAGVAVPVGAVVHKSGNIYAGGSVFRIRSNGYYRVTVNATVEPTNAAAFTLSLNNGSETIATATATPAAAGASINLTLVGVVYRRCCCNDDAITIVAGDAATVTELDAIVEKA